MRSLAIRDLVLSDRKDRISVLESLFKQEPNVQLKYEIRKAINEIRSLEISASSSEGSQEDNGSLERLKEALKSESLQAVNRAFVYCARHGVTDLLDELITASQVHPDPLHRICLLKVMSHDGLRWLAEMEASLSDPDSRVVAGAIEALGKVGGTRLLSRIAGFANDPSPRVKAAAAKSLMDLGEPKAFHIFEQMAASDQTSEREAVAFAIFEIQSPAFLPILRTLSHDQEEGPRIKAIRALENLSSKGSIEADQLLKEVLSVKPGVARALKPVTDLQDIQEEPALYSNYPEIRLAALKKVAASNPKNVQNLLLQRLKTERDPRVLATALSLLGAIHSDEDGKLAVLMNFTAHEDNRVRANAIEALAPLLKPDQAGFLVPYLQDSSNRVRGNALIALENLPEVSRKDFRPDLDRALKEMVEHKDENFRLTALYCIGILQRLEHAPYLATLSRQLSPKVKETSLQLVERLSRLHSSWRAALKDIQPKRPDLQKDSLPTRSQVLGEASSDQTTSSLDRFFLISRILLGLRGGYGIYKWVRGLMYMSVLNSTVILVVCINLLCSCSWLLLSLQKKRLDEEPAIPITIATIDFLSALTMAWWLSQTSLLKAGMITLQGSLGLVLLAVLLGIRLKEE